MRCRSKWNVAAVLLAASWLTQANTVAAQGVSLLHVPAPLAIEDEPPPRTPYLPEEKKEPSPVTDDTPLYKNWWFWAITAAVIGGTVAFGASQFEATTPTAKPCSAGVACFGDGRGR